MHDLHISDIIRVSKTDKSDRNVEVCNVIIDNFLETSSFQRATDDKAQVQNNDHKMQQQCAPESGSLLSLGYTSCT